jgi:hypothetical protein
MIGRLIDRWEYTWADIWEPLGSSPDAPIDLYNELFRTVLEKLRGKPTYDELSLVGSDPQLALEAFQQIKGKDFKNEVEVVAFLEDAYEALEEFGQAPLTQAYVDLIRDFLQLYNLRYRLVEPFGLRVQFPWLYADVYSNLCQLNESDPHLLELMAEFEEAFDTFVRSKRHRDLRTSISKASNYAEGIASVAVGTNGGTLGKLVDQLEVWPHDKVRESVKNLYHFCSDYPGIRHAGNKTSKLRDLDAKDTILMSALLMTFSSYMQTGIDMGRLLK